MSNPSPTPLADNVAGALCYLAMPLSALALLLLAPYSARPFVRFHALQAVFTFATMMGLVLVMRILSGILFFVPLLGRALAALLVVALAAGIIALWIWLIYQALDGKRYRLPVLGDFAARQSGQL